MVSYAFSPHVRFSSFPAEVLALIFGNFCKHCRGEIEETPRAPVPGKEDKFWKPCWEPSDIRALHSLCLVSRRLGTIAQPFLYHQFVPGYGTFHIGCGGGIDFWPPNEDEERIAYETGYDWHLRLIPFIRTMFRRPDLAALVQVCFIDRNLLLESFISDDEALATLKEAAEIRSVDLSSFMRCCPDHKNCGMRRRCTLHASRLVTMLLACLPNLTCLFLSSLSIFVPLSALKTAGVSTIPFGPSPFRTQRSITIRSSAFLRWPPRR
jgi:hypothetical protein